METREFETRQRYGDVVLRTSPKWSIVVFFALLALLHYTIALISFAHGRWEAYMSVIFGTLLALVSCGIAGFHSEVAVLTSQSRVRLRTGIRRLRMERSIPFSEITGVRLTLFSERRDCESRVELLCRNYDDIECPPTRIPRQEALYFALAIEVPLQKISEGVFPELPRTPGEMPSERV